MYLYLRLSCEKSRDWSRTAALFGPGVKDDGTVHWSTIILGERLE